VAALVIWLQLTIYGRGFTFFLFFTAYTTGNDAMISYLLQGLTLGLSAAATPGPFQAFLLSEAASKGWRSTLAAAFAPLLSDGPIIAVVLLILTQTPAWFLDALKIGGGFFIVYLAWGAWQAYRTYAISEVPVPVPTTERKTVWQATVMNLLNPNPYIFWSAIGGPILIEAWRTSPMLGVAFMVGIYVMLIGGFMGLIFLFSAAGQLGPKVNRALIGFSAVALGIFGIYQVWQGIAGIGIG
jgi:threonine/homoserine/homoserine lactone efflux protein